VVKPFKAVLPWAGLGGPWVYCNDGTLARRGICDKIALL